MSAPYSKKGPGGKPSVCKFFLQGRCRNLKCPFIHSSGGGSSSTGGGKGAGPSSAADTVMTTLLKLLFQKQQHTIYSHEQGLLNLSKLRECEDLVDVKASVDFNSVTFCDSMCRVIKETIVPSPGILQLDGNGIRHLGCMIKALEKHGLHEGIKALSARDNDIATTDFVSLLRGFPALVEIALNNNPVTNTPDYKNYIRKLLPSLNGLDMKSIRDGGLALPWPALTPPSDSSSLQVLTFFQGLCQATPDSLPDFYAMDAHLSVSLATNNAAVATDSLRSGGVTLNKDSVRDIIALRLRQMDNDHNITRGVKTSTIFRGRTMCVSKLVELVYPQQFDVFFDLHPVPQVTLVDAVGGGDVAIVTAHGYLVWRLKAAASSTSTSFEEMPTIRRRFARTLCIAFRDQRFVVVNDALMLLSDESVVLFDAKTPDRLETIARRFDVGVAVVTAALGLSSTDRDLYSFLDDVKGVPMAVLEECVMVAQGSAEIGLCVARLVVKRCLTPSEAITLFGTVNCDPSQLAQLLPSAASS
mmetsp:Transcript_81964/g.95761  ORF Transcript_81964/g.95761 Transcript_81964/m.95761 type:complete len:528 (-) Transcript_81964:260-1843(-)